MANGKPGRPRTKTDLDAVPEVEADDTKTVYDVEITRDNAHVGPLPDKQMKGAKVANLDKADAEALENAGQGKILAKRSVPADYAINAYPERRGLRTGQ